MCCCLNGSGSTPSMAARRSAERSQSKRSTSVVAGTSQDGRPIEHPVPTATAAPACARSSGELERGRRCSAFRTSERTPAELATFESAAGSKSVGGWYTVQGRSKAGTLVAPGSAPGRRKAEIDRWISYRRRRKAAKSLNMPSPELEGLFALLEELVPLVHGGHSGDRAALVVQDLVRHMWRYPEPRHA